MLVDADRITILMETQDMHCDCDAGDVGVVASSFDVRPAEGDTVETDTER